MHACNTYRLAHLLPPPSPPPQLMEIRVRHKILISHRRRDKEGARHEMAIVN